LKFHQKNQQPISSNFEQCWLWKFVKNRKYSSNVFKEWLSICDDVVIFWWISRKGYSRIDSFDLMLRGFTAGKTESCDLHCRRFLQHVVYVLLVKICTIRHQIQVLPCLHITMQ
jgi:hypothetical protein